MLRRMGHDVPADVTFVEARGSRATAPARPSASIGELFAPRFSRDTAGLFGSFFFCLMVNYVDHSARPSMLQRRGGFTPPAASRGLRW